MTKLFQITALIAITTLIHSCSKKPSKSDKNLSYVETNLPFTGLKYFRIKGNKWIRKPENILAVHETLKKIGYDKFISADDLATYQMWYYSPDKEYLNIPLGVKIDSLVITYPDYISATTFYKEFWQRRVGEQNDKVTFKVLSEVKQILLNRSALPVEESLINDTLFRLVSYDLDTNVSELTAINYFNYLKNLGLHLSAHNLLFENYRYQGLKLDRDNLDTLLYRTSDYNVKEPWIADDTK